MSDVNALIPIYMELRSAFLPSELKLIQTQGGADPIWVWVTSASPAERRAAVERIPSAKQLRARKEWSGMYVVEMPDGVEVHIQKADQIYDTYPDGSIPDGWDMAVFAPPGHSRDIEGNGWIASKTAALLIPRQVWLLEGGYIARDQRERARELERWGLS